ncbi:MAG: DinB family protein [Acidobacteria bacterium]|nr:DinB family protein [Acidobacteriota bacterium]
MKRRNVLKSLAASAVPAGAAAADTQWSNPFAKSWRDSFLSHWADTKTYTLAMMEAMPDDGFASKPDPAQRGFGEQFIHIARANNAYMTAFGIGKAPTPPEASTKQACRQFLTASFDYVTEVLHKMEEKQLLRGDYKFSPRLPPHSGTDLFMRAYMHTAHHRGQAVVYLRVKGIVPPTWKFEPTGA